MSRVGKSATKTEAETRESDLISVRSCVCKSRTLCRKPRFHHCIAAVRSFLWTNTWSAHAASAQAGGASCSPLRKLLLSHFSLHCATAGSLNAFITQQGGCGLVGTQQLLHLEQHRHNWLKTGCQHYSSHFNSRGAIICRSEMVIVVFS